MSFKNNVIKKIICPYLKRCQTLVYVCSSDIAKKILSARAGQQYRAKEIERMSQKTIKLAKYNEISLRLTFHNKADTSICRKLEFPLKLLSPL